MKNNRKININCHHADEDGKDSKVIKYNFKIKRDENNKSISFRVCDIEQNKWELKYEFNVDDFLKNELLKTNEPLNSIKNNHSIYYQERMEASAIIKNEIGEESKKYKVLQTSIINGDDDGSKLESFNLNSFVYSAWESYNNHNHLVLRPDNIWMAILTQLSFYINKNSEELREKFVDFTGKKELIVETEYRILEAPFEKLTIEMSNQIQSNIKDPSIKDLIIPDFTTTTESDKVVFSIALMSTMKKYFDYRYGCKCGLSEVTLLGEINDWINLKERVEKLIQFDNKDGVIKKWLNKYLLAVIDKFIDSAKGNPDTTWWNQIVDYKQRSGGSVLTGWLATFCVFDNDGKYNDKKFLFFDEEEDFPWPRVNGDSIPNGYVSCPIKLKDIDQEYNSTIYSGHFGSKLLDNNSKLIPSLDWFIIAKLL
ncbi:hypothetical protein DDB_G0290805 [Dictyostelium discoideum AX4]|uniref:DUF4419 domain-containing protein n=1 Tax=Dictyostelium discoideum TaxID=44689 RepID=Q54FJ5_DICDI|nr:hypothetical protein DDB_G0290805 [Dictyostelium discoideum AX4]EAL62036.1 hypothetical protein DDB_G0290805 [Dictyostelium discoideum AX4]|eukprot:XP_635545.1 hypothetical protein DDB_G0290805 [Dictyostelium discoideum AX4]